MAAWLLGKCKKKLQKWQKLYYYFHYSSDLDFVDMGTYQCLVKNEFGTDRIETFVYPVAVSHSLWKMSISTYSTS